ncbi:hypothetical protein [Enterocloster clostridioformis]|uniref:hypothetical protein n=1 Tax=Enterocloster clostridioformis TaxID=1531 RepID=UPI000677E798|nr:hypothetical protein [Enterocloster clostridioformis]
MATGQIQVTPAGIVIVAEGVAITISGALDMVDALGTVEVELSKATSPGGSKPGNEDEGDSYSYKNGTYDKADYHSGQTTGRKNPAPKDGQFALDNSVPIGENTTRRIGLDSNGDFVVFDETSSGVFHGHTRTWKAEGGNQGLTQEMKNALYDAGFIKSPTGSKFKLTDYAKSLIRN